MKKLLLAGAVLASTACGADDVKIETGPAPTPPPAPLHPLEAADEALATTTTVLIESPTTSITSPPEPVPTTMYVAPVTTTTAHVHHEPASPQSRTVEPAGDIWWELALCESGGANVDTGNGYSGYFQFMDSTWRSVGYSGRAVDYGYETQVAAAQALQSRSGWGQWPACSRALGLR